MIIILRKSPLFKRALMIAVLLTAAILLSVIFNYKNTGVFIKTDRRVPIYSVDTDEKEVSISFDVSWGDDHTKEILDILDKYNVKATFFIVGAWASDNPDTVKEIYKRGHEIGNHSDKHPKMNTLSKERIIEEIASADAKILALTGEKTNLFRCPEGEYNNLVIDTVEATNHYPIQWDVDSIDWRDQGADTEYNRVIKNTKPGSIILFHNYGKYTPITLPRVLERLQKDGYKIVKVSDLIYKDNYYLDSTGKQIKK